MAYQYPDLITPIQVGASLAARRQDLMLQRDRARMEAEKFLLDQAEARRLEDYRSRLLGIQEKSQERLAEELSVRMRQEQRMQEAAERLQKRQETAEQQQATFYRTMAGLAPVLGQRNAAQAAAALSGWMPSQIASDMITSQGAQRAVNLGSRKIVDPISQQVVAEIPFISEEERRAYLAGLDQSQEDGTTWVVRGGKLVPQGGPAPSPGGPAPAPAPAQTQAIPTRPRTYSEAVSELERYDAIIKRARNLMRDRPAYAFAYLQKELGNEKAMSVFEELKAEANQ